MVTQHEFERHKHLTMPRELRERLTEETGFQKFMTDSRLEINNRYITKRSRTNLASMVRIIV
jgi:hypothetical protein